MDFEMTTYSTAGLVPVAMDQISVEQILRAKRELEAARRRLHLHMFSDVSDYILFKLWGKDHGAPLLIADPRVLIRSLQEPGPEGADRGLAEEAPPEPDVIVGP